MKSLSRRNLFLAALVVAFLAAFGWIIATQGPLAPIKVTVAKAAEMRLDRALFGIGTLEARRDHSVGPTVAGRLQKVLVDHGDTVQAGQLLAEMEPVDLDARLAAGAAAAAAASQRVQSAQAALAETESRARLAKNSAERYADLRRRNFFSQEATDAKAHEAAAAASAQQAATAALAAAKEDVRRAQSELAGTGKSRAHLRLTSPVDGIVSARLAEPGSTVVAGQAVVRVIEPTALWFKVRIDQGRSSGLAVGLPANIAPRSVPGKTQPGRVARVDLVGDAVTEERIAYVALDVPPPGLSIGELAEVTLQLPAIDKALAIPAAALTRQGDALGVWKPVDGRAQFAAVTPGVTSAQGHVQVLNGLVSGETVLVYSSKSLAPDARVKVVDSLVKQTQK